MRSPVLSTTWLGGLAALTAAVLVPSGGIGAPPAPAGSSVKAQAAAVAASGVVSPKEQEEFFNQKIAPMLSEACYKCHSAAEKTKGGLALDSRSAILKGGDDGAIFVPGEPGKSMIYQRVTSKDADEKMPPKDANLSASQVADLEHWIQTGAWVPEKMTAAVANDRGAIKVTERAGARQHWAWQPVKAPYLPAVKTANWVKTPVDNFILAKLEAKGINPSPMADRPTLIRRAYFDLVGLPPMPWEVQAFVEDKSPNAWEKVIDRLLASPRYGERWGRYWLDVARYADTKGNIKRDTALYVDAWTYRDYVIDAFNQDKPYDRFVEEQIAADKLNLGNDKRPLAALGFLTLGDRFMNNANDIINDRIDVVTKGFLGLTVSCARCHDHMFDPIPQKDYYSLHGIFASTVEPKDDPIIGAQGDAKMYQDYLKAREEALAGPRKFVQDEIERTRGVFRQHAGDFLMGASKQGMDRRKYLDNLGVPPKDAEDMVQFARNGGGKAAGAGRRSPLFGPFYALQAIPADKFAEKSPAVLGEIASGTLRGGGRIALNPAIVAMFKDKHPQSIEEVAGYYTDFFKSIAALPAMNTPAAPAPAGAKPGLPSAISPTPVDENLLELKEAPFKPNFMASIDTEDLGQILPQKLGNKYQTALTALRKVEMTHPGAPKRAMVVEDAPKPVNSPVFIRGEAGNRGEIVPHRFLEILSGPERPEFKQGSGRLELAEAIASKTNPLTARVMVNRIWLHHFGDGIVETPDDFGTMSGAPSHRELLDFLALKFMQGNWSVKSIHKLIMMSAVYQQTSETNETYAKLDPDNRLLWRCNIRRLDFEPVRDSLLYIAGKLDLKLGGQPVNILAEPYSQRRSVYGYIDRSDLPDMMNHFDFANPDMPEGKRHETTVPQQALFMMNSPMLVDVARKLLARPEMAQAKDDAQRIHALYWMIYQRPPKPEEIQLGLGYVTSAAEPVVDPEALSSADGAKTTLVAAGDGKLRPNGKPVPPKRKAVAAKRYSFLLENVGDKVERKALTPWEKYTQALLMANETVYYN